MKYIKYYNSVQECVNDDTIFDPPLVAQVVGSSNQNELVYVPENHPKFKLIKDGNYIIPTKIQTFSVNLNNQWQDNDALDIDNLDAYESFSNKGISESRAVMYIKINGYTNFYFYVRSDAESDYDYVIVSELDSNSQKFSTSGNQNSGTGLSSYTKVEYTNIPAGEHTITITYKKDVSIDSGEDRGYVLIPKNQ